MGTGLCWRRLHHLPQTDSPGGHSSLRCLVHLEQDYFWKEHVRSWRQPRSCIRKRNQRILGNARRIRNGWRLLRMRCLLGSLPCKRKRRNRPGLRNGCNCSLCSRWRFILRRHRKNKRCGTRCNNLYRINLLPYLPWNRHQLAVRL